MKKLSDLIYKLRAITVTYTHYTAMESAEKVPTKNVFNVYDPRSTPVLIYVATELIPGNSQQSLVLVYSWL